MNSFEVTASKDRKRKTQSHEHEIAADDLPAAPPAITKDKISLEAVINVLVQQGLCTEEQLAAEESRLRAIRRTITGLHFVPVNVKGRRSQLPEHGPHSLRRWASQRRWARKLGTFLFGWKWKKHQKPRS